MRTLIPALGLGNDASGFQAELRSPPSADGTELAGLRPGQWPGACPPAGPRRPPPETALPKLRPLPAWHTQAAQPQLTRETVGETGRWSGPRGMPLPRDSRGQAIQWLAIWHG